MYFLIPFSCDYLQLEHKNIVKYPLLNAYSTDLLDALAGKLVCFFGKAI